MTPEQEMVHSLLVDTITLLCRNGLTFSSNIKVQGLLAITVDSKGFFVVQIDETIAHNLIDNPAACGEPDQLDHSNQLDELKQTMPFEIKQETVNHECLPGRKRVRPITDEMNVVSKSFCPQSPPQKDLLVGNSPHRFVNSLSSVSTQVKLEDDDLMFVDSSGISVVGQNYDSMNSGGNLQSNRKVFGDGLTMAAGPSRSGQVKAKQVRRKTIGQRSSYKGIEWTGGQGDVAVNYGDLDEMEEKHQTQSQQDMTDLSYDELYKLETGDEYSSEASGGAMTYACQYEDCDKTFNYNRSLLRHQRQVHGCVFGAASEVTYFCRINRCTKIFRSEAALSRHHNKAHGQSN